jgi:ABC-type glycerol-3-phosphate transport system permease component
MLLANQVRVFVTSGAVAQWYFAPPGALSVPRGTTWASFRHALGPSFGSLCLSSLVLTVSQLIRDAMEK